MRKPNLRGKVARTALSAVLAGAMAMSGVVGPVGTALGDEDVTFTMYNKKSALDTTNVYWAFRVFSAGDVNATTNVATDVEWGDSRIKAAVMKYITDKGFSAWLTERGLTGDNPSYALNFISNKIAEDRASGSSYEHSNSGNLDIANYSANITTSDSFATGLALAIATANYDFKNVSNTPSLSSAKGATGIVDNELYDDSSETDGKIQLKNPTSDGYYVLTPLLKFTKADDGTVNTSFDGKAPIWVPYTGSSLQIGIKDYVGTITKLVLDDATGAVFGSVADAAKGQDLDYQITVTMPKNGKSGSTINVIDEMPAGISLRKDSVKVKVGAGTSQNVSESTDTNKLGFSISGNVVTFRLGSATGADTLSMGDPIVLTYKAALTDSASTGLNSYNTNKARLSYLIDSVSGETVPSTANVTSYQLALNLIDSKTKNAVAGTNAKFTIQDEKGQYITATGERGGTSPIELSLGTASTLSIPYLDEGVYTIKQTAAPAGYELTATNEALLTVTATKAQGLVTTLEAVTRETDTFKVTSVTPSSGLITLSVPNLQTETIVLPITGMTPSQLGTIVGALLIVGGGAVIIMRRRNSNAAA